ncbi:Pyruvoyl-dependent arginine decarboxylase [Candidatus Bilamarchaeum dharawalense]|uniref:Pyruvoyl-dependent arginine decarboxylase n=1 Tax=Candidatus Bilamarchaeum dharawalense TaxID=2885759 RepID=A0A5E4LNR1_9ARCH|nr:Pyruvoyl-dependent arginine decarboxylase [Candidatus Bilamarchaeum dharawalense]
MNFVPKKIFFTKGVGKSTEQLTSFEFALRDAGIAPYNLVSVSSIFPPHAKIVSRREGLKYLKPGQVVFVVMSRIAANEPNRLMSASVGCAIPANKNTYGYLSEHHAYGQTEEKAGEYAEDLAASMLASTLGMEFDPDKAWNEREQYFKMSGQIVRTTNTTQSAICDKNGKWTSVIAAAVLIL